MLWISTKPKNLWKMIIRACQKVKLQMLLMEQNSLSSWALLGLFKFLWCMTSKSWFCLLLKHKAFSSISIIDIRKDSFSHDLIRVMLLYRSLNPPLTSFYNTLENVLSDSFIDIKLGDFNNDILNSINMNLDSVFVKLYIAS